MGDLHFAVGKAAVPHFQDHPLQHAVLAPGLAEDVQLALGAGLAQHPDAQGAGHHRGGQLDAAVAGQVVQRLQREQQVGVPGIGGHGVADLLKGGLGGRQGRQAAGQQAHLGPGGKAVQHKHLGAGVLVLVFFGGHPGGVVAAGQGAGDGHHKDLVRPGVSRQEIPHVGAGGRAFAFIGAQAVGHGKGVGAGVVHIFLLVGDDLQRHTGVVHPRQLPQIR